MKRFRFKIFTITARLIFFVVDFKLSVICLTTSAIIASIICPVRAAEITSQICRVCGATTTQTNTYWLSLPVCSGESFYHRKSIAKLYDAFIRVEHEHEWCDGYVGEKTGTLFSWQTESREMKNTGDDSTIYQPRLTHIALIMAYNLRYSPVELRRKLHREIINSVSLNEYYEICALYDQTLLKNGRENWKNWLENKGAGNNPDTRVAIAKSDIPMWTYSAASHIPSSMEVVPGKLKEPSDYSRNWFHD